MAFLYLTLIRRISLLLLLMAAASMRPGVIAVKATEAQVEADASGALAAWNWPMEMAKTSYRHLVDSGRPLPKIEAEEMAPEFENALTQPFHFPPFPMPLNRRWRLWQQRYNKHLKELQVYQTWLGDLQSPAIVSTSKLKRNHQLFPANEDDANVNNEKAKEQHEMKREPSDYRGPLYRPSISAGVMTNLGDFFKQLKANVHFAEHSHQLGEGESQLLEGLHPYPLEPPSDTPDDADYDSGQPPDRNSNKLLQSVRSYRPSQKIRSLVSRNPNGYRGSQFIDPSYMWLGLGK
ncbi:uncharacterized protein LOC117569211 isoform X1 [Drosophila albomicans]|uniref:Uncharacterized protein LOC117569211 isoform X1 n=1 Tax=Drosophila albomicans TaxID=7291 RepID=A0A6P8WWD3_DROAB|nr:uncharacterized protein LOC117569211 isoform X1 [Drosophila albomicans]